MYATATTDDGRFELREPRTPAEWNAYHSIRERAIWHDLGIEAFDGPYDPERHDPKHEAYTALVLVRNGIIVGTMGFEDMGNHVAQIRAVGVEPACQHHGYGSVMMAMAEDWARNHGFAFAWVYAHENAVMFYAHNAYTYGAAHSLDIPPCPVPNSVILAKRLASGMRRPNADMMIAAA